MVSCDYKSAVRIAAAAVVIVFSQFPAHAQTAGADQDFSLFEDVESANNTSNAPNRPSRESRATISEPEFTLVGTSRIGSKFSAIVRHRSGETVLVKVGAAGNTAIDGHAGYSVVDIGAGAVSIRYPGNNACVDFSEQGVRCSSAGNIAELALANAEPLAGNTRAVIEVANDTEATAEEVVADPANPFEALRNGNNGQGNNGNGGRFVPRRINPEDVPEGMRIIATPFGDRLVEQ